MLERLELVGFKSFADKTHFDFAEGVTGIVGPNGSGKSNVVDAVRWVLGEQSAKSMRGGEMTDVIFNGSASRRSLGMAEVSMVFDNRKKALATDSDKVRITRRVYRSGEGEYLINNQPCRLKDIKDLFLGSGAGTDAYCIIQQGQVDILLQTAPRERRTIFEEAAGISRFKAKKLETLRRLERVDANLTRLRDILDEVEKQLRSVKLQASKAQRHQEYHARLKELRVGLSLREYHKLDGRLAIESAELCRLKEELEAEVSKSDEDERALVGLEDRLAKLVADIREQEAALAAAREQIAVEQGRQAHERGSLEQAEQETQQTRSRLAALTLRVVKLFRDCGEARGELEAAALECGEQRRAVESAETALRESEMAQERSREEMETQKGVYFDQARESGRLRNEAADHKAQLESLTRERNRLLSRSVQAAEDLASIDGALQELCDTEAKVLKSLGEARDAQAALKEERDRLAQARDETAELAGELRAKRSGLTSRLEVLERLERSHEGLSTGAREVFAHLEQADPGPWRTVVGMVGDLLAVRREFAPLIDLALGERAQRFLVRDPALLAQALRQRGQPFSGRVSFLHLGPASVRVRRETKAVSGQGGPAFAGAGVHPGVIAPADSLVRCEDPNLVELPQRLLGNTLIVHDLVAARAIVGLGAGFRCITPAGELLDPDGTLTVGTHHAEAGILSRKSELRELREQLVSLDRRLAEMDQDMVDLRDRIARLDARIERAAEEIDLLAEQAGDMRQRISRHEERRAGLNEEVTDSSELGGLEADIDGLHSSWQEALERHLVAEQASMAAKSRLEQLEREAREREGLRGRQEQDRLARQVALGKVEERLASLTQRQKRLDEECREREVEHGRLAARLATLLERLRSSETALLDASSRLARAYHRKESAERLLRGWLAEREEAGEARQSVSERVSSGRSTWRQRQESAHDRELTVNSLSHVREGLCSKLREDYQIELGELYTGRLRDDPDWFGRTPEPAPEMLPEDEIIDLRKKLAKLGSVNLEAIEELAELEARHGSLQTQFDDLTAAQKALQEIISRINADSRKLFTDVFETIKGHFQELFRKLFGGGMADIVLEEGVDILESGIEIVARPPGKELRSISLMSGGEKTMTAVALLMAIFKSKPSPFCILDEVDAALDEANVGRFTAVLREFLALSQFIVVTHHKRTMMAADELWGVTMAEAGVSTRYAVRAVDWPDDEKQAA